MFRRSFLTLALCALCLSLSPLSGYAAHGGAGDAAPRPLIVLASFGSTDADAQKAQEAFHQAAVERYAPIPVRLAVTARLVQRTLKDRGQEAPSLFRVLADVSDEGYTHVAVQSIQVIAGDEFKGVAAIAAAQAGLPKGIERIALGAPLVASNEDAWALAEALLASLPADRKAGEPVIFVGHGAEGTGGLSYPALNWHLQARDSAVFISTVEGTPAMEDTLAALPKPAGNAKIRVWLAPLLALAGEHARNDIMGGGDDSWKSTLTAAGYQCMPIEQALLSVPAVRDLWFAHLDEALRELGVR
jgi:sirohydrochlorin cobaltochelatase